ncbi:hypothetical protein DM860_000988 [Cuscuta australis]|uniref:Endonuclease/exonuclease/phosphatase domain-containing protein n=1 Tax=Cuscuta australis TaxID=267555 RepID=A0A328DVZ7_9ASTE|nr:hypothetical protein DM860_000988 [Cuscuta australis]
MKALFWNVCGVKSSLNRLINLKKQHNFLFLAILEPIVAGKKIDFYKLKLNFSHGFSTQYNKCWIFWDSNFLNLLQVQEGDQITTCLFHNTFTQGPIYISAVYGKHNRNDRLLLWDSISDHNPLDQPWIVGGDFNTIATLSQHHVSPCTRSMEDFMDCIINCSLLEPCLKGNKFTWMGNRVKGRVLRRLDRILINQATLNLYSETYLYHLGRTSSDHKPLLLDCISHNFSGPKPFRFINAWTLDDSFHGMVTDAWNSITTGRGMRGLATKLKHLKKCIKDWNHNHFGNIFSQVKETEMEDLQAQEKFEESETPSNREALNLANAKLLLACNKELLGPKSKCEMAFLW